MAGLVPAIHVLPVAMLLRPEDVDARHKAGHDKSNHVSAAENQPRPPAVRMARVV
jgi:hypothetical protein